ncbi:MAG TPA: hypothetical protein VJP02_27400 [Candidatus Sulfotelmatobacter sp.]|nr:hypothetical protein [Candidatus Sulfotelmatobacter sp.]
MNGSAFQRWPTRLSKRLVLCPIVALPFFALVLCGCKRDRGGAGAPTRAEAANKPLPAGPGMHNGPALRVLKQPGSAFHVEYSDRTTIVDMDTVALTLRGISEDHRIFLFEDSPELRAKLVPGHCVLFQGLDLRKVDAYAVDPNTKNLIVGTEKASLREALTNANVQWKAPVNFGEILRQTSARMTPAPASLFARSEFSHQLQSLVQPTVHADVTQTSFQGEVEFNDSDFATWKVHYRFNAPGGDDRNMHLDVHLTREANGLNVELSAKGTISNFIQQFGMVAAEKGPVHVQFRDLDLRGDIDFDWTIKTSENKTPMNEVRFKLPGKVSIPLVEFTDLPMSLQISEAMLFHPAFTTKEEVARGTFHVKFASDEGIQLDGAESQVEGQGEGDADIGQNFAFSPLASFGLVIAMAVPRIELRMGSEELFEMAKIPLPSTLVESLSDVLLKHTIVGQWVNKKMGNPLSVEGAAYFQVVISTTAAHSGMQSLVPCQQFTMTAKGQIGLDAEWLGNNTNIQPKDVFEKNLVRRQPDVKICGGGS